MARPPEPVAHSRGLALLLAAIGVTAAVLGWRALAGIVPIDPAWSSMAARLGVAALALLPAAGVLWFFLVAQMACRLWTAAFEPLRAPDGAFLVTNQRIIGNTLEQLLVFAPSLLALAAGVPAARMAEVIALGLVFAVARLAFWLGYLVRPMLRAPGMAATFATTTASLGGAIWIWLA